MTTGKDSFGLGGALAVLGAAAVHGVGDGREHHDRGPDQPPAAQDSACHSERAASSPPPSTSIPHSPKASTAPPVACTARSGQERRSPVMTIGDLARRTSVAVKVLRRQQDMGLIYTRGRSPAGYRLFDENALRCVQSFAVCATSDSPKPKSNNSPELATTTPARNPQRTFSRCDMANPQLAHRNLARAYRP